MGCSQSKWRIKNIQFTQLHVQSKKKKRLRVSEAWNKYHTKALHREDGFFSVSQSRVARRGRVARPPLLARGVTVEPRRGEAVMFHHNWFPSIPTGAVTEPWKCQRGCVTVAQCNTSTVRVYKGKDHKYAKMSTEICTDSSRAPSRFGVAVRA